MNVPAMSLPLHVYRRHKCSLTAVAAATTLLVIVLLPLLEIAGRALFGEGINGSINYVRHATLWFGYLGAVMAARKSRHISLGIASFLGGRSKTLADALAQTLAVVTCLVLARAAFQMAVAESSSEVLLGGLVPLWLAQSVMPVSFVLLASRYAQQLTETVSKGWLLVLALAVIALAWQIDFSSGYVLPAGLLVILVATLAGTPVYIVLGSLAALLFATDGVPLASISVEAYRIASNPILPTIPLFTLAGTVLASGNASSRLVRLFEAWFGWMPGGSAVAAIWVCAFFTTFTGGSGVTILALGGLMLPVLLKQRYKEGFSLGVLTSSGGLGILLPPSLLVILYGVASHTPINQLFIAGVVPGLLLITMTCGYAMFHARSLRAERRKFEPAEALQALWESKWEVLIPVGVLYGIFSGIATLVEVAAATAAYTLLVEFCVHRDIKPGKWPYRDSERVRHPGGRYQDHSRLGHGAHQLPHLRGRAVDGRGPDPVGHQFALGVPARTERRPAVGGMPARHHFRHRGRRAADAAGGGGVRYRPAAPGDHFPGQHGTRLPDPAGGHESLPGLVPFRKTADDRVPGRAAVLPDQSDRGPGDHVRTGPVCRGCSLVCALMTRNWPIKWPRVPGREPPATGRRAPC